MLDNLRDVKELLNKFLLLVVVVVSISCGLPDRDFHFF
jgi:hypothetical protein